LDHLLVLYHDVLASYSAAGGGQLRIDLIAQTGAQTKRLKARIQSQRIPFWVIGHGH
jgi:hypothetical protein